MSDQLTPELEQLTDERDALLRFKRWVHAYLDGKGIPFHPPGTHGAEGCRIGDRMDFVFDGIDWLRGELASEEKEKLSWRHTVNAVSAERDKWQGQWEAVKGVCEQRDAAIRRAEQAEALAARLAEHVEHNASCPFDGVAACNCGLGQLLAEARAAGVIL